MKLITNSGKSHKSIVKKLIKKARSIDIVTSRTDWEALEFILNGIANNKNKPRFRLITGGELRAADLETLNIIRQDMPIEFYMVLPADRNLLQANIYLFHTDKNYHVILGGASCTKEGLETDMVASVYQKKSGKGKLWSQTKKYIKNLIQAPRIHLLTTRFLARYETYYRNLSTPDGDGGTFWDNENMLINNREGLDNRAILWVEQPENVAKMAELDKGYRKARKILNRLASQKMIAEEEARKYVDQLIGTKNGTGYWNINGLQGSKSEIVNQFDTFREMVRFVHEFRDKSPGLVFEGCQNFARPIKGVGVNMISEILITYEPERFAKLNSELIQKLVDAGGLSIKKSTSKYNSADYQKYSEIIRDYADQLGIKSLAETDLFFTGVMDELDAPVLETDPDSPNEDHMEADMVRIDTGEGN